ncbi:hypothetical protein CGH71_22705 [Vibrio parahaemolyticus]|nr:hypothetical protein CGH71_22705 [Vibrio parahaemolyticus]
MQAHRSNIQQMPLLLQKKLPSSLKLLSNVSLLVPSCIPSSSNALLRGEQRNTKAAVYHLNHLNQRIIKMPRVVNPS